MASKGLLQNGTSLLKRLSNSLLHRSLHSNHQTVSPAPEIATKLFPSLSKLPTSLHLPQNEAESLNKFAPERFLYPCGLPSLPFFLPDGDASSSENPMLFSPKGHSNLALSGERGIMVFLLGTQPRVAEESLLEE